MHGSTSPSKNRCPACSQRQVAPTSATTSRTGSASGSMPKSPEQRQAGQRRGPGRAGPWRSRRGNPPGSTHHLSTGRPRRAVRAIARPTPASRREPAPRTPPAGVRQSGHAVPASAASDRSRAASPGQPSAENRPGSRQLRRVRQGCSTAAEVSVDLPETLGHRALCSSHHRPTCCHRQQDRVVGASPNAVSFRTEGRDTRRRRSAAGPSAGHQRSSSGGGGRAADIDHTPRHPRVVLRATGHASSSPAGRAGQGSTDPTPVGDMGLLSE